MDDIRLYYIFLNFFILFYFFFFFFYFGSCWTTLREKALQLDRVKRIWYLLPMRAAKVQASLRIRAVSPEPSLLAHTSSESRGTFRQKARSLGPLNGWACAVKICHDGMLEDTNSLDGAQFIVFALTASSYYYYHYHYYHHWCFAPCSSCVAAWLWCVGYQSSLKKNKKKLTYSITKATPTQNPILSKVAGGERLFRFPFTIFVGYDISSV